MRSGREATPTAQHDAKRAPSRRRFVQGAGLLALGASPLAALAAGRDTGEGVTFADGLQSLDADRLDRQQGHHGITLSMLPLTASIWGCWR